MDAKEALRKLGGKKQKKKGLPKRYSNPLRKERRARHFSRLTKKKLRRVIKHNGTEFAKAWATERGVSLP